MGRPGTCVLEGVGGISIGHKMSLAGEGPSRSHEGYAGMPTGWDDDPIIPQKRVLVESVGDRVGGLSDDTLDDWAGE